MNKLIVFGDEAKNKIQEGINTLANSVKVTLGPKGRNVIIEDTNGHPYITKDGVSVARSVFVEDKLQNAGIEIVKEVAAKTNNDAGDGTTTATVLAQSFINEGLKLINNGYDPNILKSEMEEMYKRITEYIENIKVSVNNDFLKIEQVATISANNDKEIGKLIAKTIKQIGEDGVITVNESGSTDTKIDIVEGMQFDQGYISPYFITDAERSECILENARIYLTDKKLTKTEDVLPMMQQCAKEGRPLFIVAQDVAFDALQSLVLNKVHNILHVCAVKAPGFSGFRKEMLDDMAALTNGKADYENFGYVLGSAEKVIITKDNFTIINNTNNSRVNDRINMIKSKLSEPNLVVYTKENLQQRLAKLSGGVAVIHVGAGSEVELKEKKDRIEDALHTTHAALQEGIVAGGGTTLYYISKQLDVDTKGKQMVVEAIKQPAIQILKNAGKNNKFIKEFNKKVKSYNFGFDSKNDVYCNLITSGIIDAAKVVRMALQNAISVASTLLTTECMIIDDGKYM